MAFPTVAAVNGGHKDTAGTSHTVNLPSGIVAGNLLGVLFADSEGGNVTVSFPSGWTQLFRNYNGAYVGFGFWYRVADGTEGSTITVTTSGACTSAHTSYRITDYSGTPEAANTTGGPDVYPDPPSLGPSWGAKDTLWIAACGYAYNYTVYAYPTSYTNGRNDYSTHTDGPGVGSARRNLNAASENPGSFEISEGSTRWVAATVAVKPVIPIVVPTVTTSAATNVEETTATGNGNITDTGGENCDERGFDYDVDSGPPYAYSATDSGSFGTGAFSKNISALTKGELYYFRAKAHNSAGWGYGSELTFLTKPDEPTGLTVTEKTPVSISLSWTKGAGANRTMVRRKTGSYPTSPSDGVQAYFDTGSSFTDSGLTPNTTYYYRAWSEVTEGGLQQWSDAYAQVSDSTPNLYKLLGYIGDVIDCTVDIKTYERLEWEEEIPSANEDIILQIRSSVDQVDWSDWQYIYSSPCTNFQIPIRRYVEWKAKQTTTDGYHSPKLESLTFTWNKYT